MPKVFIYVAISFVVLALVPPALIARARTRNSEHRRIHIWWDMDSQAKFKAQTVNDRYADGRAARPPIAGTVARQELRDDDHFYKGFVSGAWVTELPPQIPVDRALLERGQERFDIYCSVCHGHAGYGDGTVHERAMELMNNPLIGNGTTWVAPKSVHDEEIRSQPVGQLYNTITNGIRNMSGYASQIEPEDRWAIALYVKALQRSQNASPGDVPAAQREGLPVVDLMPQEDEE